jgi:hypothetical protein
VIDLQGSGGLLPIFRPIYNPAFGALLAPSTYGIAFGSGPD